MLSEREPLPDIRTVQIQLEMLVDEKSLVGARKSAWMILEKDFPLSAALKTAEKNGAQKAEVERALRELIPAWFWEDRASVARSKHGGRSGTPRSSKLVEEHEKTASSHLNEMRSPKTMKSTPRKTERKNKPTKPLQQLREQPHEPKPTNGKIALTEELIKAGATAKGGYTSDQRKLLGVKGKLKKGWIKKLLGKEIPEADYKRYLELSTQTLADNIVSGDVKPADIISKRVRKRAVKRAKEQMEKTEADQDLDNEHLERIKPHL